MEIQLTDLDDLDFLFSLNFVRLKKVKILGMKYFYKLKKFY